MSATAGNTCQMCGGNGHVRTGGRRGGDSTCPNCAGTGQIPLTPQATEPVSRFAEYADDLVSQWPPLSPAKLADLRRIIARSLAPQGFEIHQEVAA